MPLQAKTEAANVDKAAAVAFGRDGTELVNPLSLCMLLDQVPTRTLLPLYNNQSVKVALLGSSYFCFEHAACARHALLRRVYRNQHPYSGLSGV